MSGKPKSPTRSFPPSFKQAAMVRLEAGEALTAVARNLGVSRKVLYGWRALWRSEGAAGLCHKRGPKPGNGKQSASEFVRAGRFFQIFNSPSP